jgi:hypothetical protein
MKKFLLAPLILAVFGAATAFAGGCPVMYVVVDRVETTQDQSSISMIRIWGSFSRDDRSGAAFPVTIDLSKKQVLINWSSDATDKLDLPLNPNSTLGSQVGRNSYKLEAVKVP